MAKSQPAPPANFKVKTATEIAVEKEEEFKKSNPQLALWMGVKKMLTAPDGAQYFESQMKGRRFRRSRASVLSAKPAVRSKEIVVGVADPNTPEITLKLDAPLKGKPEIGEEIEFEGVPSAFSRRPLHGDVRRGDGQDQGPDGKARGSGRRCRERAAQAPRKRKASRVCYNKEVKLSARANVRAESRFL